MPRALLEKVGAAAVILLLTMKLCLSENTEREKRQLFREDLLKRPLDGSYDQRQQGEANQNNPDNRVILNPNDVVSSLFPSENGDQHHLNSQFSHNNVLNNNHLGDIIHPIVPSGFSQPIRFNENDAKGPSNINYINNNALINNGESAHYNEKRNKKYFTGIQPVFSPFHPNRNNYNSIPNNNNNNANQFVPSSFHLGASAFENRLKELWNDKHKIPEGNVMPPHVSFSYAFRD